jgi:hypothetical protein
VWTNPDGFSWLAALRDETKVGLHVALTPTWSETAEFADYVLPMGHSARRYDTHSYETHAGRWLGFRQPVRRVAMNRLGREYTDTRDTNPGEVWEGNEFWFEPGARAGSFQQREAEQVLHVPHAGTGRRIPSPHPSCGSAPHPMSRCQNHPHAAPSCGSPDPTGACAAPNLPV